MVDPIFVTLDTILRPMEVAPKASALFALRLGA